MKKHPKMRCPVCGMVVWLRNIAGFHKLQSWIYTFGIGRGKIKVEEQKTPDYFIDYWITRLKEVIAYLEKLKLIQKPQKPILQIKSQPMLRQPVKNYSIVVPVSASVKTENSTLHPRNLRTKKKEFVVNDLSLNILAQVER